MHGCSGAAKANGLVQDSSGSAMLGWVVARQQGSQLRLRGTVQQLNDYRGVEQWFRLCDARGWWDNCWTRQLVKLHDAGRKQDSCTGQWAVSVALDDGCGAGRALHNGSSYFGMTFFLDYKGKDKTSIHGPPWHNDNHMCSPDIHTFTHSSDAVLRLHSTTHTY